MKKVNSESKSSSHLVIPVFIMNSGCPHRCTFCNEAITAGNYPPEITRAYFDQEVNAYFSWNKDKSRKVEIAFYGGNFTGVDPPYQEKLLTWASAYVEKKMVHSIRISTRPDYVSEGKLRLLKQYGVDTVEIGAQSFVDAVLEHSQRGHNSQDIEKSVAVLKKNGFRTGLHLMAGLPGDTREGFFYSVEKTIQLQPDTVRIHPVVVLRNTVLAEEFKRGMYQPLELTEAVTLCALAWEKLSESGIRIIRMGLQVTPEMEKAGAILAGPVHPAFGSLVLSTVFYNQTVNLLESLSRDIKEICFKLSPRDISIFRGLNNSNIMAIKKLYPGVNLIIDSKDGKSRGEISIQTDTGESMNLKIPGIR
jgi:histone acetyltransferase (RNA polymerase elongator complex component)